MNETVKLLFDECIGSPIATAFGVFLQGLYTAKHEIKHIREFQLLGTADEIWVPQVRDLGFMIVTADRSKDPKGIKMRLLCLKNQITQITLGPSVHHMKSPDKIVAITSVWNELVEAANAPAGSRFIISCVPGKAATLQAQEISAEERDAAARYLVPPLELRPE